MKLILENWNNFIDEAITVQDRKPVPPPSGVYPERTPQEQQKLQRFLDAVEKRMEKEPTLVDKIAKLLSSKISEGEAADTAKQKASDIKQIIASLRKDLQSMKPSEMELMMQKIAHVMKKEKLEESFKRKTK